MGQHKTGRPAASMPGHLAGQERVRLHGTNRLPHRLTRNDSRFPSKDGRRSLGSPRPAAESAYTEFRSPPVIPVAFEECFASQKRGTGSSRTTWIAWSLSRLWAFPPVYPSLLQFAGKIVVGCSKCWRLALRWEVGTGNATLALSLVIEPRTTLWTAHRSKLTYGHMVRSGPQIPTCEVTGLACPYSPGNILSVSRFANALGIDFNESFELEQPAVNSRMAARRHRILSWFGNVRGRL